MDQKEWLVMMNTENYHSTLPFKEAASSILASFSSMFFSHNTTTNYFYSSTVLHRNLSSSY